MAIRKKITVKTIGKPPLGGAAAFAQLLIDAQKNEVRPTLKLVYDEAPKQKTASQNGG